MSIAEYDAMPIERHAHFQGFEAGKGIAAQRAAEAEKQKQAFAELQGAF